MDDIATVIAALVRIVTLAGQGLILVVAVLAVAAAIYGLVVFAAARHRAGVARLARADRRAELAANRRARLAHRTVIDHGTGAVTVETRRR